LDSRNQRKAVCLLTGHEQTQQEDDLAAISGIKWRAFTRLAVDGKPIEHTVVLHTWALLACLLARQASLHIPSCIAMLLNISNGPK
jgi:hypothetical protein